MAKNNRTTPALSADLKGMQIGYLTVLERERRYLRNKTGLASGWLCLCVCGKIHWVQAYSLFIGHTKSCGCRRMEAMLAGPSPAKKHGMRKTRVWKVWSCMKDRCLNPNHTSYKDYGGRGIMICARWLNSFENFFADMGEPPIGFQLDRRNNDGGYSPDNCRWVDTSTQQRNTRGNRILTVFGESKPAIAWLEDPRCIVNRTTLYKRLQLGWSDERALTVPRSNVGPVSRRELEQAGLVRDSGAKRKTVSGRDAVVWSA